MISASEIISVTINNTAVNVKNPLVKQNGDILVPIFEVADELGIDAHLNRNILYLNNKNSAFEEVSSFKNINIKLLARKSHGYLRDFILCVGEKNEEFHDWANVEIPDYYPKLYSLDVTNDGKEEVVVVLTTKKGNGSYINEVHIFEKPSDEKESVKEIFHENMQTEVQKNTAFTYTDKHLKINLKGKEIIVPKYELPSFDNNVNISLGNFILYKVENQKLKGVVLVSQNSKQYIGSIIATYRYHNGVMVIDKMEFKRH
jgi:hypothetical protein